MLEKDSAPHSTEPAPNFGDDINNHFQFTDTVALNSRIQRLILSLWLGLSPIIDRSYSPDLRFEETTPPRTTVAEGNEGGIGDSVSFVSEIDGETFSTAGLEDFYVDLPDKF